MSHTPSRPSSGALRRGRSRLGLALLPAALLATGCSGVGGRDLYENSFSLGFPEPVTDRADDIYELWLGSVAAAAVVLASMTNSSPKSTPATRPAVMAANAKPRLITQ